MYFNLKIFEAINGLANQSKILDALAIFLAEYLPYLLMLLLLSFLFWPKKDRSKNRAMVLVSVIAALVARLAVKNIILLFYSSPRPFISLPSANKLISASSAENWQSFPSGHTILFFALSAVIYSFNRKVGIFFFFCSALMGTARVFVGVHWPSDILAGAVLGIIVGIITMWLYTKYKI